MKSVMFGAGGFPRPSRELLVFFGAFLVLLPWLGPIGCGAAPPPPAVAKPVYTPEEAALFNDLFRPELFGSPSFSAPESDGLLPDRVIASDSVVAARVVTVTREGAASRQSYSVVVMPLGPPIAGGPLSDSVTLTVAANSPAFAWLEAGARRWVGSRLLLFLRHYQDGPHFHGAPDTPDVRAAVLRARMPSR
ncbi:MAG TPA: hypothetical protein VIM73_13955 [Polyangiaceae bacterium]